MSQIQERQMISTVLPRSELADDLVKEMYALHTQYFVNHQRSVFNDDLAAKDQVILLKCDSKLVGFSTLQVTKEVFANREIAVLYSGDTIIDQQYWGKGQLEIAFLETALKIHETLGLPLYWLLLCSGFRTYRYLTSFMNEYWPRWEQPTPPGAQEMLDYLSVKRFGDTYHKGVVKLSGGQLRGGVSPIDKHRLKNPHVEFFARRNPGHPAGDELVCITPFNPDNLNRFGLRVLNRRTRQ